MVNKDLTGKIAMITGAGSGIGAGIAKVLFERGATLALCDLYGESVKKTSNSLSKNILHDSVDVTNIQDIENFRNKILDAYGTIDILVANAGVIGAKGFSERKNYSKNDWEDTFDVNVLGMVNSADAIVEIMKEKKYGKIIKTIQGKGLVAAIHIINPLTNQLDSRMGDEIIEKCMQKGLLMVRTGTGTIKIGPTLIIPDDAMLEGIAVIDEVLAQICMDAKN